MKRKNIYEQPETVVTRVELESPICSGSANYVGENETGVNIAEQGVITPDKDGDRYLNDFSGSQWGSDIQ